MTLTAAGDILESAILVGLNNPPLLIPTRGEGASAEIFQQDDIILPTAANVQYSTYTMGPRIPTNAKIKKVSLYGKGIDSNSTAAVAMDINLIFSDAPIGGIAAGEGTNDGTTYANAGQIPTSSLNGTTTSITAYASPNKMFGSSIVPVANSGAYKIQEITYANSFTYADRFLPIWDVLGYTQDPGGFFNFFLVCETAASTAAAGVLGLIVDFVS
jgi:hypothetical protein